MSISFDIYLLCSYINAAMVTPIDEGEGESEHYIKSVDVITEVNHGTLSPVTGMCGIMAIHIVFTLMAFFSY